MCAVTAMQLLLLWVWSSPMQAVLQVGWQRVIVVQCIHIRGRLASAWGLGYASSYRLALLYRH